MSRFYRYREIYLLKDRLAYPSKFRKKLTKRIKGVEKIMSFAGSQSGAFANTIASDLRKK